MVPGVSSSGVSAPGVSAPGIPAPGAHGGDGARLAEALGCPVEDILDLSASLNPMAPDPAAVIGRHLSSLGRYPDPTVARDALAATAGFDPERLVVTNGGAEAIALVAAEHPRGWVDGPEFALYQRHLTELDPAAPLWRSNPHNPTGCLAAPEDRAGVWDEAFWPLATGTWTRGDADLPAHAADLPAHAAGGRAIVLGSLTKLLACPGLRVGYVYCAEGAEAARIRARQPQWSVNGLVAAALPELLSTVELTTWATGVARLRLALVADLEAVGLEPWPSDANWVLVPAPGLRDRLATQGICVRDAASFGFEGVVRIAVPDDAGRQRLRAALERVA